MPDRILLSVVAAVLIAGLSGCDSLSGQAKEKEVPGEPVELSDLAAPARAVVETLTAGGQIRKIDQEEQNGRIIYDVEATVGGRDVEYDVAADGTVLSSEQGVEYASLPDAVKAAVQEYFGSADGLKASREVEEGQVFYEVEGTKDGDVIALKLTATGRILEEEKE